ncbi:MAG: signal peptidase II, partial [Oscillospiraceae bacterium]
MARNLITGKFGRWMLILVLAGGLGNCIDRAINGYVVDMFQFAFFPSFPIFNVADIFITLGGIAFCVWLIFHKEPEAPTPKKADGTQRKATGRPAKGPDYITQMKKPGAPSSAPVQRSPQGTAARQAQGTASRKATAQRPAASRPVQEAASQKSLGFADWNMPGFDDISAPIGSPRPTQEPTEKRPAPAQSATEKRTAPSATSAKRSAQSSIPVQHSETAPAQAAKNSGEEFSLEDILAEFSKKMINTYTIIAEESGDRIDALLALEIDELTRSQAARLLEDGAVTIGCKPIKKNHRVTKGEVFVVEIPEVEETELIPENIPLDIAFEDDDIVVVNKPRGMVVHPAPGHASGTLVNALIFHCGDTLSGIGGEKRPGIVHRIDKDTSGLLIVAKNDYAHRFLS